MLTNSLPFVVQYRRKDGDSSPIWIDMAAFDVEGAAERFCGDCTYLNPSCPDDNWPWEYRIDNRSEKEET